MKILFFGTPDFAAEILNTLALNGHNIIGAVSQPDKPKGRGHKLLPTDVKLKAQELGICVYQPETLKDEAFLPVLKELNPEVIVVAAYGKILPEYIIDYAQYGCINVHASILHKYRGAAPIQWSVINGDKTTGVSIMRMDYGLDTGDVIDTAQTPIGEYETAGELFDRLSKLGAELLLTTLSKLESNTAVFTPQNDKESTYAPKITKENSRIDWNKPADVISKLICGMSPFPTAITTYNKEPLKIFEAEKASEAGAPGEILKIAKGKGMLVACGSGALYVKTVQFAGGKKMNIEDYARGHEIVLGTILGEDK